MFKRVFLISVFICAFINIKAFNTFRVAVYCTRFDVEKLSDKEYFDDHIKPLQQVLHIDKVYLEIHRQTSLDIKTMLKVKKYFNDAGIETAAGITATGPRGDNKFLRSCVIRMKTMSTCC